MIIQKLKNRLVYINNKRMIRIFDRSVDHSSWCGAEFFERHFEPFKLNEPSGPYKFGVYRETVIDDRMGAFAAKIIDDFKKKIVGFLGERTRLDDIYLFWYDPNKRGEWSFSNSWHDDNVGHRIKIYACFEGNGTTPTVVIPRSYNKPYKRRKEERLRFSGIRDISTRNDEIKLAYRPGDIAMFDTSCLHRGLYEQPAAKRAVLVMEFIDKEKCNQIAGILPCAPGMSRNGRVTFSKEAYKALQTTGLLDEELIAQQGDSYIYSLKNRD